MIYVSKETERLLKSVLEHLRENANTPARIVKADILYVALKEYAKILGLREKKIGHLA